MKHLLRRLFRRRRSAAPVAREVAAPAVPLGVGVGSIGMPAVVVKAGR
ncbi:hypothetical protein P2Q00_15040 [Streptomyces coacervatus]|nr:hypothetical protein [Streptomyces coacervatus]MDF2266732.1 hypothetical protein [Streptomyces coacervatus]